MNLNTNCKNCLFSNKASTSEACSFNIIEYIEDNKECVIKDDFYYIKNYQCRFGLDKNTYEDKIKTILDSENIDIKQYIAFKNAIKYYLVIDYTDSHYPINEFCQKLQQLQIPPKFISIIFYQQSKEYMSNVVDEFNKSKLGDYCQYKIHNFVESLDYSEALFSVLETTIKKNNSQYLWLLSIDSIDYAIQDGSIEKINFEINVKQPICNMLRSRTVDDNELDTLFLNFENYSGLTKNINQSLLSAIKSMPNISIYNYD